MRKRWTDIEIELLRKEYVNEQSVKKLSIMLDRSEASIKHKASRLGIKVRDGKAKIRKIKGKEYWYVCKNRQAVLIHKIVAEKMIGRKLRHNEIVHHKNRNSLDNRKSNLEVMTISEHMQEHYQDRELNSKGQFI